MKLYILQRPRPERQVPMEIGTCDQILRLLSEMLGCYPERAADLMTRIDSALDERLRLMRKQSTLRLMRGPSTLRRVAENLLPLIFGGRSGMSLDEVIQALESLGIPEGNLDCLIEEIEQLPGVSTDEDLNFTWAGSR